MIHLDTSFLIRALVKDSPQDAALRHWLTTGEDLAISAIAWAEFVCGPLGHRDVERAAKIVPTRVAFTEREAREAARLFNSSGRRRGSLIDCMIAATAILDCKRVATENEDDFDRFADQGLAVLTAARALATNAPPG